MSQPTFFEKLNNWLRNSISFKIFSVGFLALLMLIPTGMIQDLIRERQFRSEEAIQEINSKWAKSQFLIGPVISIPYYEEFLNEKNEIKSTKVYAHFLPKKLDYSGKLNSQKRKRGIYESVLYEADLSVNGKFENPDFAALKIDAEDVLWDEALIAFGITDLRGINDQVSFSLNDTTIEMKPGVPVKNIMQSGISNTFDIRKFQQEGGINFSAKVSVNGSENLQFFPIGETTEINLTSDWPHPSFNGSFLPDSHNITPQGFDANWKILQLNRNFPQQWTGSQYNISGSSFGLEMMLGVNQYQKNERSAKYGFLIIALTFLIFFFMEVINKRRIHPIQYLLVGFALSIFYTLLLSFSEKMDFGTSYLLSSIAVIGLITVYVHAFIKKIKFTSMLSGVLMLLFGFIFIILQLQDYALMFGSIGLFLILAVVMFTTRKIDWYKVNEEETES